MNSVCIVVGLTVVVTFALFAVFVTVEHVMEDAKAERVWRKVQAENKAEDEAKEKAEGTPFVNSFMNFKKED